MAIEEKLLSHRYSQRDSEPGIGSMVAPVFSNPEHISFTKPKNQVLDSFVYFERPSQAHAGSVNMALAASISLGEGDEPPEGERHPLVASKRDTEA